MERLQKVIAAAGITSRRKAEVLISEGRVAVNGETITELGYKVKRGDLIEVDGKAIEKEDKVYFLMNKPKRTMCTSDDEFGRQTGGLQAAYLYRGASGLRYQRGDYSDQ